MLKERLGIVVVVIVDDDNYDGGATMSCPFLDSWRHDEDSGREGERARARASTSARRRWRKLDVVHIDSLVSHLSGVTGRSLKVRQHS